MTRSELITVGVCAIGVIGASLKLAHEVGRVAYAVEANTVAIVALNGEVDALDHTWAARLQICESIARDHTERITRLETNQ